jgi:probable HAF family extracellular repeat protein
MVDMNRRVFRCVRVTCVLGLFAFAGHGLPAQQLPPPATSYGVMDLAAFAGAAADVHDTNELSSLIVGRARTATGAYHAFTFGYSGQTDLGTLGGAESTAFGYGGGGVVGQSQIASGQTRAFLYLSHTNTMTNLGTLGGTWSAAYGAEGAFVVGASRVAGDARIQAFVYSNGTMTAIPVNRGGDSAAKDVNGFGDIVGYACTASNVACKAFLYASGVTTELGPAVGKSVANRINSNQQVVGTLAVSGTSVHAFIHLNGLTSDLGTLGGSNSEGLDINEFGHAVGTSQNASGAARAFLWRDGTMTDLNSVLPANSGWVLESATAISDGGQIVGIGRLNGARRPFLLTPENDQRAMIGGAISQEDSNLPKGVEVGKTVQFVTSALGDSRTAVTIYDAQLVHTLTGPAEFVSAGTQDGNDCQVTPSRVTCRLRPIDSAGLGRETSVIVRATGVGTITHIATLTSGVPDPSNANNTISEDNRSVALAAYVLVPETIAGGKPAVARVTLTGAPPAGDAVLRVSSNRPDIVPLPATFIIPSFNEGSTREFAITPKVVASTTPVNITISYGLVTITRTLTVVPPKLVQLYLTPTTVIGGCGSSSGRILLNGPAPAGGAVVPLTNTNAKATVPSSVTVPAGATSATFAVSTAAVTAPVNGSVTARFGGVAQTLALGVRPIRAQTLTLSPNPVRGGTTVTGTISLECPAAPGAIVVTLKTGNAAVAAPIASSVTIPAGAATATFAIRTSATSANTPVSIEAWVFGVRKSATLGVTP